MNVQVMKKVTAEQQQNYDLNYEYNLIYPINDQKQEQKSIQISQATDINEIIDQQQNQNGQVLLADKSCHFEIYDLNKKEGILKFYVDQNKRGKFIYTNNVLMLLLYSDATIITTKGELDVDQIMIRKGKYQLVFIQLCQSQEKPAQVIRSIEIDFCPTHFTCGNNIIALYQKIKNSQFKLHIIRHNEQGNKILSYHQIMISRRCKTLAIDGNDVILITKGKKESYWFQRFSNTAEGANIVSSRSSSPVMSLDQVTTMQENVQSTEQIYSTITNNKSNETTSIDKREIYQITSPSEQYIVQDEQIDFDFSIILNKVPVFGEQQYIQISKLEYQFRTLMFSNNSLLCGRFDTYLLMQKKRNPQNCILHSQFLQYDVTEKVACCMSDNGYTVVSVDPMQMGLNVYLNYQFYKFLQSSANGKIFKEKFNDVTIVNNMIVGLANRKLVNFGSICNVLVQFDVSQEKEAKQVEISSFILNKEMNQMIIQRKVDNQDQLIYCSCVDKIEIKIANIIKQDEILLMKQTPIIEDQEKQDKNVQVSPQQAIKEFSYDNKIIQFARTTENRLNVYWREPTGQLTCGMLSLESLI